MDWGGHTARRRHSISGARRSAIRVRPDCLRLESYLDARRLLLIALALPRTRFFLSGFLRKVVPIGIIGTLIRIFWTVPQEFAERRREIFKRADRILRETGDSVYLSPEGMRVTTGEIGAFNKGSFIWRRACMRRSFPFTSRFRTRSTRAWVMTRSLARPTSTFFRRSIRRRGGLPTSSEIATASASCSCGSTTRYVRQASFPIHSCS